MFSEVKVEHEGDTQYSIALVSHLKMIDKEWAGLAYATRCEFDESQSKNINLRDVLSQE